MGVTLLPDLGTEILIPVCAVVGIAFSLIQWFIVSQVKLDASASRNNAKNGIADSLIEEEEGLNDHSVVTKCAEIQNAISEGIFPSFEILVFQFWILSFSLDLRVISADFDA